MNSKGVIQLLVVDDHVLIYDGLAPFFDTHEEIKKVYYANTKNEMFKILTEEFIDVIILDINVHGESMLEQIGQIRKYRPEIRILILTSYDSQNLKSEALDKEVDAYINKNTSKEEILFALGKVVRGEKYISSGSHSNSPSYLIDNFEIGKNLTQRELDVLRLLAKGYTNGKISQELFISIHTIQSHRKNMFRKLDIHSVNELISFAYQNGLV